MHSELLATRPCLFSHSNLLYLKAFGEMFCVGRIVVLKEREKMYLYRGAATFRDVLLRIFRTIFGKVRTKLDVFSEKIVDENITYKGLQKNFLEVIYILRFVSL